MRDMRDRRIVNGRGFVAEDDKSNQAGDPFGGVRRNTAQT